jgi:hypothetical protein
MKIYIYFIVIYISTILSAKAQKEHSDMHYQKAFNNLKNMLANKSNANLKNAVFHVENAYFDNLLDYQSFEEEIEGLTILCQGFVKSNSLQYTDKDKVKIEKFASVFKILTDTLFIRLDSLQDYHLPFGYDFEDFFGDTDWTKGFVSKLLASKKGNCHSLPYLYKILCDELGAEAHLALAPNHLYIKHHSKKTGWYNTELTSATFPIDAWLMVSGYISLEAIQNAVYMDTIGTYRAVALCVVDLGQGYAKKYPDNDGTFILQCCELALKHFPTCINAMLLKAETLFAQHKKLVQNKGKDDTESKAKFTEMNKVYQQIYQSGYRQMPKQMYANWLLDLKENKDKYINKKVAVFKK